MKKITFSILATLLVALVELSAAEWSKTNKPNILFILADNWRWPTAGALGDPMARTPAFDRIAHEGGFDTFPYYGKGTPHE